MNQQQVAQQAAAAARLMLPNIRGELLGIEELLAAGVSASRVRALYPLNLL